MNDLKLESHPLADFSPLPHYDEHGPRKQGPDAPEASLRRDTDAVYRLALCYHVTKDERFSTKAEAVLDGWGRTMKRVGSDQGKAGINFNMPSALMGAALLKRETSWNTEDFSTFVRTVVVPANNSKRDNNHGDWGVLLLVTSGGFLDDDTLIAQGRQRWLELMKSQVAEDGSLPLEICRSNTTDWCGGPAKGIRGIAYTHFLLLPATLAAEVLRNLGQDVYATPGGDQLRKAYIKSANWTLHPETFPYYAANKGKLEDVHNIDYFFILQRRFPTPDGQKVLDADTEKKNGDVCIRMLYPR